MGSVRAVPGEQEQAEMFWEVFKDPLHGEGKKESKTEQQDPEQKAKPRVVGMMGRASNDGRNKM